MGVEWVSHASLRWPLASPKDKLLDPWTIRKLWDSMRRGLQRAGTS